MSLLGIEKAKEIMTKAGNYSCVSYLVLEENGHHSQPRQDVCYSGLRGNIANINASAIVSKICRNYQDFKMPKQAEKLFVEWMMNDSVYKDCFIDCTPEEVLSTDIYVVRADIPGNLMVSALTAMRSITESNLSCKSAKYFKTLVDAGITPDFSFILSHFLDDKGYLRISHSTHHSIIDSGTITCEAVSNFCKHKITAPNPRTFKDFNNYNGIHQLFNGSIVSKSFYRWLYTKVSEFSIKPEKSSNSFNPFVSEDKGGDDFHMINPTNGLSVLKECSNLFYSEYVT